MTGRKQGNLCCVGERDTSSTPSVWERQTTTNYLLFSQNLLLVILVALLVYSAIIVSEAGDSIKKTSDTAYLILKDIQKPGGALDHIDILSNETSSVVYPVVMEILQYTTGLLEQVRDRNYTSALDTLIYEGHMLIDRANSVFASIFRLNAAVGTGQN